MKTSKVLSFLVIVILGCYYILTTTAHTYKQEHKQVAKSTSVKTPPETQSMCAGPIPTGWLKAGDSWDPTTCGNPTTISYNIYKIVRYDNLPSGSVLGACNIKTPPNGWIKVSTGWDPTTCGHPTSIYDNLMQIKKL